MKDAITSFVKEYVDKYPAETEWRTPLVGFAEANGEYLSKIRQITDANHAEPRQDTDLCGKCSSGMPCSLRAPI